MKEKRAVKIGGGKTKIVHMYTYVRTERTKLRLI